MSATKTGLHCTCGHTKEQHHRGPKHALTNCWRCRCVLYTLAPLAATVADQNYMGVRVSDRAGVVTPPPAEGRAGSEGETAA